MASAIAPPQTGPHVWTGSELNDPAVWTWQLTHAEVDLLIAATSDFAGAELDDVTATLWAWEPDFGALSERLAGIRNTLVAGRGFQLVSGLPVDDLAPGQSAAIFVGIGSLIGAARSQNAAGDLLGNVRNVGLDAADPEVRIYQTDQRQTFHTDSSDAVGLLCLQDAAEGGESLLVSAAAIYNRMLEADPELAAALFDDIATDRRGEVPVGCDPWFTIPVLSWFDNALTVIYQRQYIESAARFPDAPRLTESAIEALDRFDEIANDPAMHLRMKLRRGDMQFVHNHSLLHDRTRFVDRPGSPRHLLRLWLSLPGDRRLPESFTQRYGSITVGDRGGIVSA